ncbi:hypothetical protein HAX54_045919, partial [Datura stramonium]|nr:hypothetical protein [Datura stramonium]
MVLEEKSLALLGTAATILKYIIAYSFLLFSRDLIITKMIKVSFDDVTNLLGTRPLYESPPEKVNHALLTKGKVQTATAAAVQWQ